MDEELQGNSNGEAHDSKYDDDGHLKRRGTWVTATAHMVTFIIGAGVLSLEWAMAQLGWIAGTIALIFFTLVALFSSFMLCDCYRYPDPVHGKRNQTYLAMAKNILGGTQYYICGLAQYGILVGATIGYCITASISMVAIKKSNCYHRYGHDAECHTSNYPFMVIFGIAEILLSQIPNFHELSWVSAVAAAMSFGYASIGMGLSIAKIAGGNHPKTSLTGLTVGVDVTSKEKKLLNIFQAIGNLGFSYAFGTLVVEIQDTLKSSPPENQAMKKATIAGTSITSLFYVSCAVLGYVAFGNKAPGNFLTGFGFYEPYWLVDLGNVFIVVHLVGAYQVYVQPVFQLVENWCQERWPESNLMAKEYAINIPLLGIDRINLVLATWRTLYVIFTTVIAMIFPFFNSILGLNGACAFWFLTVYFPIEMYLQQAKVPKFSLLWTGLKLLSGICFIVSLAAAVSSIQSIITELKTYKPFKSTS